MVLIRNTCTSNVNNADIVSIARAVVAHYTPKTISISFPDIRFHSYLADAWIKYLHETHEDYINIVDSLYKRLLPEQRIIDLKARCLVLLHEKMNWHRVAHDYHNLKALVRSTSQKKTYWRILQRAVEISEEESA